MAFKLNSVVHYCSRRILHRRLVQQQAPREGFASRELGRWALSINGENLKRRESEQALTEGMRVVAVLEDSEYDALLAKRPGLDGNRMF